MTAAKLNEIKTPQDLRQMPPESLPALSQQLREFILDSVSRTGGHFASNLGTVELTLALHHVYNTPEDRLVWDVGHQTYPHKALTGRADRLGSIRQLGGLSGFPRRDESEYDTFGVGHSSTSISAALGMAEAARLKGEDRRVVAIIGDGSMSGGIAFEALNNAGSAHQGRKPDLLVILNDNDMSISGPVGALTDHLRTLGRLPPGFTGAPATLFEALGFEYTGPVDGHDVLALHTTLTALRERPGPRLLHVVTRKGKGYAHAEADPIKYHAAPGKFDLQLGFVASATPAKPTFTQVFGKWLCEAAESDPSVIGVTPAMCEGSGMVEFKRRFPQRFYDVGIAEQHALTFAAGLACERLKPVVAIYSTFLQRAYDQLIHDIALQSLPVVLALDRAGLVGADGATHAGAYDIPYLRCIPNMAVLTPSDDEQCRRALSMALQRGEPAAVRYPRGAAPQAGISITQDPGWGKAIVRRQGRRIAILAFGTLLHPALQVAERLNATAVDMRFAKPLDEALVLKLARTHQAIVTVEEGAIAGGAGAAVMQTLQAAGKRLPVLALGLADEFIEHGTHEQLLALQGLDATGIERAILARFPLKAQAPLPPRQSVDRAGTPLLAMQAATGNTVLTAAAGMTNRAGRNAHRRSATSTT